MIPRVRPGQAISAKTQNKLIDLANTGALDFSAAPGRATQAGVAARVINESDLDIPFGGAVALRRIDGSAGTGMHPYADAPTRLVAETILVADAPVDGEEEWGIAAERIPAGRSGLVYLSGLVLARLRDEDSDDDQVELLSDADWWHLSRAASGAGKVVWVDETQKAADESDTYAWRWALVRFPIGGGGSLTVVQAQEDGADGVVSVKAIELTVDAATSPNFTTPGDAFDVRYLHL